MSKKNVLIIVHTEYHMLVAASIIADMYADERLWQIQIVQTLTGNSPRFKFPKNISSFPHVSYRELHYDEGRLEVNGEMIALIKEILSRDVDTFITFNKLGFIDFFLIKRLKKSGAKIVLAPDGAAAYVVTSLFTPRWSMLLALRTFRYLWKNKLFAISFYWPTLKYGGMREIDELWVQFPDAIDGRARKPTKKIDVLSSPASIRFAREYFGYKTEVLSDVIFYTNQPFRDSRINDLEIALLEGLRSKFPHKKIIVKLHPTTFENQGARLASISDVEIIRSTIPAELMIAALENSIVLGFWSTSMLLMNSKCRFYWTFPMLQHAGISMPQMTINRPSPHIRLAASVNDIE